MKRRLRLYLLLPAWLMLRLGAAQDQPTRTTYWPQPSETALRPVAISTVLPPTDGVRFQYQVVRAYDNRCVYLAPAWHGQTKLEPARRGLFSNSEPGEIDGLVVGTLNELAMEGWELVEVQTLTQPTQTRQKVETSLPYNDPQRPAYTSTTTIETLTQTRYLFRRPLTAKP